MHIRHLYLSLALALASGVAAAPLTRPAQAAVEVSITTAPPPLPVYEQPPLPGPGYMWIPGYWAYDPADGYYWVPGTWVEPPEVGLLWTPGYWAWEDGGYVWNAGYWGPTVGFYGGVDYGFGYNGVGFFGGRWDHGAFAYNIAAWNVGGVHVAHSYREAVANRAASRVSFNGGQGGLTARPTAAQEQARRQQHVLATAMQTRQADEARNNRALHASQNHGKPPVAATARPGDFQTHPVAATNAAEPDIGRPNGARPAGRNAGAPTMLKPGEHNAAAPATTRPPEHNAEGTNARPPRAAEERPVPRAANRPESPTAGTIMHPEHPSAERPAMARPTARPPVHREPAHQPAAAPHPMARPPAAAPRAAAPHPQAQRPAPAREEKNER